jgi:flagellar FliJ protein
MKRVERLQMVEHAIGDIERRRAEALATSERHLAACAEKLAELENYHGVYTRQFNERAEAGIGGAGARDYQTFLARLAEAVRQQSLLVARARTERDAERVSWQGAAQRAEVVGRLVRRWRTDEQRLADQTEQRESDERAQHHPSHERAAHGA